MEKVLISACLLGARVRYHGGDARVEDETLDQWAREGRLVAICPEVAGGLATPRPPAELVRSPDGVRRVITVDSRDVTDAFERGARAAIAIARAEGIRVAILKDFSPSCATSEIHDGSFSGRRVDGTGVTAAALQAMGVEVFSERQIPAAAEYLKIIERR